MSIACDIPATVNQVLLPANAHLYAHNLNEKIVDIYFKASRFINIFAGCMLGYLAGFAEPFINGWLGYHEEYKNAVDIMIIFSFPLQMNVLTGPATAIFRGINEPQKELAYLTTRFILIISATALALYCFGKTFFAINIATTSMMLLTCLYYIYYTNNYLAVSQWRYIKKVLLPGIFPYFIGFGLFYATQSLYREYEFSRINTLIYLFVMWLIYMTVISLAVIFAICTKEEIKELKKAVRQVFKKMNKDE